MKNITLLSVRIACFTVNLNRIAALLFVGLKENKLGQFPREKGDDIYNSIPKLTAAAIKTKVTIQQEMNTYNAE